MRQLSPFRMAHMGYDPYNTVVSRLAYEGIAHGWGSGFSPAETYTFIGEHADLADTSVSLKLVVLEHADMDRDFDEYASTGDCGEHEDMPSRFLCGEVPA